jgi:hypothetical protein
MGWPNMIASPRLTIAPMYAIGLTAVGLAGGATFGTLLDMSGLATESRQHPTPAALWLTRNSPWSQSLQSLVNR